MCPESRPNPNRAHMTRDARCSYACPAGLDKNASTDSMWAMASPPKTEFLGKRLSRKERGQQGPSSFRVPRGTAGEVPNRRGRVVASTKHGIGKNITRFTILPMLIMITNAMIIATVFFDQSKGASLAWCLCWGLRPVQPERPPGRIPF